MVEHDISVVLAVPAEGNGLAVQRGNTLGRLNLGNLDGAGGVHEIPFQRLFRVWSRGRNLGRWHAEEQSSSQCQNV